MKIAFLLYPVSKVKIDEDSSFWVMWELKKRGYEVFYFESRQLFGRDHSAWAVLTPARLDLKKGYSPSLPAKQPTDLSECDCIFIRKEPPFRNDYLYALQLLELVKEKVFVLNDPSGIAIANEKIFSLRFKGFAPETIVTENSDQIRQFIKNLNAKVVLKPLNEKGGHGVFSIQPRDVNLPSLVDIATGFGRKKILAQRFIEHQKTGDRRLLILDGRILGAFARRPSQSDFRANLSVGATLRKSSVTPWDEKLVAEMAPALRKYGLYFVGVDVIGKFLTEVNVTSPAGIPEINSLNNVRLEKEVADFIERKSADRIRF